MVKTVPSVKLTEVLWLGLELTPLDTLGIYNITVIMNMLVVWMKRTVQLNTII